MLDYLTDSGPFTKAISFPRRRDGFHIMPTSAGRETVCGPGYDWDGSKRGSTPFSVLQHTLGGCGRLRYENRSFRLRPGETMLVTIPHDHRYWLEHGEEWSFFWIAFSGQEALRLHRAILMRTGPVLVLEPSTRDLLADVCLRLQSATQTAGQASFEAYRATMALHDDVMMHTEANTSEGSHADIDRVVNFIRSNLSRRLDIPALAAVAGMSRAHFSRMFKKHQGVAPADFVLRERMERAAKLLSDSRLSVKRVAVTCGFTDPNYFSKVFRRTFSTSPLEFRTTGMFASRRR